MKKKNILLKGKIILSVLAVLLISSLSACGGEAASNSDSGQDDRISQTPDSNPSQNTQNNSLIDNGIVADDPYDSNSDGSGLSGSDLLSGELPSFSSLTEWYSSEYRTALEEATNEILNGLGETFFVNVQEPDVIIYNYQFTEQIDFSSVSQEDLIRAISENLAGSAASILSGNIEDYRDFGLPLNIIRMNYLNADGSLIHSQDISVDSDASLSPEYPASSGQYASLQEWLESEDAAGLAARINEQFEGLGLTFSHSADGNIYVYEFHITDDSAYRALSDEDLTSFFDSLVDTAANLSADMSEMFSAAYGVRPSGFRCSFYGADGTLFYTKDIS